MQASKAYIRLIFGRIARLRRMDRACHDLLLRYFANAAVVRHYLTMTERTNLVNPFIRVIREYAIGSEDNGLRTRIFSNAPRGNLRCLASIRA